MELFKIVTDREELKKRCEEVKLPLDNETREAIKTGLWIELIYSNTQEYNEMPFDTLLIQVEKDYTGFNIIRKHNDKYEGRCFYLALNGDMSKLYDILTK